MRGRSAVLFVALGATLVGCAGATKTGFERAAEGTAGTLSAAARTIEAVHTGALTREYAASTLGVLAATAGSAPDEIRAAEGGPGADAAARLADATAGAAADVASPCLDAECDWHGQVARLRSTADALERAAAP